MKWKSNNKEVIKPKEGDTKQKTRFAILPTKVNDSWILFEKYTSIYEYKWHFVYSEEVVSSGIFTEKVQGWYHKRLGWVFSHRIAYGTNLS